MEAIAIWLAGTAASDVSQKTLWIIPVMQTVHILSVAMVFSLVVMIELRVLGITKSQTIEQTAHRFVPWIFSGVVVLALTGTMLIVGEPKRSLPSYEFQMKMLYLAVALAFTIAFAQSVRQHALVWETAGGTVQTAMAGVCPGHPGNRRTVPAPTLPSPVAGEGRVGDRDKPGDDEPATTSFAPYRGSQPKHEQHGRVGL